MIAGFIIGLCIGPMIAAFILYLPMRIYWWFKYKNCNDSDLKEFKKPKYLEILFN